MFLFTSKRFRQSFQLKGFTEKERRQHRERKLKKKTLIHRPNIKVQIHEGRKENVGKEKEKYQTQPWRPGIEVLLTFTKAPNLPSFNTWRKSKLLWVSLRIRLLLLTFNNDGCERFNIFPFFSLLFSPT